MFPRQNRGTTFQTNDNWLYRGVPRLFPIRYLWNRKHRQGGEGAGGGVHFQGHGGKQPLSHRIVLSIRSSDRAMQTVVYLAVHQGRFQFELRPYLPRVNKASFQKVSRLRMTFSEVLAALYSSNANRKCFRG